MGKEDEDITGDPQDQEPGGDTTPADDKPTGDQTPDDKTADPGKTAPDQNWEKRFKGLQPKHQDLTEAHKGLQAQYTLDKQNWDAEKATATAKVTALEADLAAAQEELESLKSGNEELQSTVGSLETKLERNALIMSEYPDLSVLEAKGLIRDDLEGDELTTALNELRSLMVKQGEQALQDLNAGSTGDDRQSSGGRGQKMDLGSINQKLMDAQKSGDWEEADRLTKLLIAEADATVLQEK